jgi:hypothetical protein
MLTRDRAIDILAGEQFDLVPAPDRGSRPLGLSV